MIKCPLEIVRMKSLTMRTSIDGQESLVSSGMKISFSKKSYLAIIYDRFKYRFSQISHKYDFNQTSVVYVLKF